MDREARHAAVHGAADSQTWLSNLSELILTLLIVSASWDFPPALDSENQNQIHEIHISKVCYCHWITKSCLTLWPHGLQYASLPCPLLCPRVWSNPCPLSRWCHPTISCSVVPFSSCPQCFPAPGSFPVSQLFASGGQSTGASASASVLPMNFQDWFPLGWTDFISLQSKGLSRVFSEVLGFILLFWYFWTPSYPR